jgi:ankyrin repeat protein
MIKKLAILFCVLLVGFILYLVTPLPHSSSSINDDEFLPEQPTAFIPDQAGSQRKCQDEIFYIRQDQIGYADSEVVDERCAELQTELANAAIDGDLVEMRSVLQKGASAQSPAFSKHSSDALRPAITAAWDKQTEAISLLLDNGADVNSHYRCCMQSHSLLMVAVTMNDEATTKLLLARGADLSFEGPYADEEVIDVFYEAKRINNPVILEMLYNACDRSIVSRIKCRLNKASHLIL